MNRRHFIKTAALTTTAVLSGLSRYAYAGQSEKPNIMLIIGDDMAWLDCQPYGNREVHTPNMTRLAKEGMCFDSMFTSTAMCAPSRQQLYTGLYPVRNGAYPNHSWCYDGVKSLPHYLKALGYRVSLIGKTHFGPPESFPFEIAGKPNADIDSSQVDAISEFINRDKKQPYCLIVCSNQPHRPWNKGDTSAYDADKLTVPPYLVDCPETREALVKYYAEISYLDWQLGECLKLADNSGQADNTIVIFTSEQGVQLPFAKWTCYDIGLKTAFIVRWSGKVMPGTRTKAMTQYVDVVPTLIDAVGSNPTKIDTGRADANGYKGFDGYSFLKTLFGQTDKHRDYIYGAHTTRGIIKGSDCYPIRSVRSDRYKYVQNLNHGTKFSNVITNEENGVLQAWFERGKDDPVVLARAQFYVKRPAEELYDLQADPYELKNLADDPTLAHSKKELKTRLEYWMKQQGDLGVMTEMDAQNRQGAKIQAARQSKADKLKTRKSAR